MGILEDIQNISFGGIGQSQNNSISNYADYASDASGVLDNNVTANFSMNDLGLGGVGGAEGGGGGIMDFLGGDGFMGMAGNAMDLFGAISQYGMMKDQLGMQEDQLDFSKNAFNKNSANQAKLINSRQADQLASRLAYGSDETDARTLGDKTQEQYLKDRAVDGSAI